MPTIINGKVVYEGGETLPAVGSEAYKQAQSGVIPGSTSSSSSVSIQLPDQPKKTGYNYTGQGGGIYNSLTGQLVSGPKTGSTDFASLLSASLPAVDAKSIASQTKALYAPGRELIKGRYGTKISEGMAQSAEQKRALEGQMGTGRRFSSSAQAFVKFVDDENKKKIGELEQQMEMALNDYDFKMASAIEQRIAQENQKSQQNFENMFKILEYAEKKQKEESDLQAPAIRSERDGVIASIIEQGYTDPLDILNLVNYSESGEQIGDFTAEEINTAMGYLLPKQKDKSALGADYGVFEMAKEQGWISKDASIFDFWAKEALAKKSPTADGVGSGVGTPDDFNQFSREQVAFSVLPTALKNSDAEAKRLLSGIRLGLSEGKTPYEIADNLMGYRVENKTAFSEGMRKYISLADLQPAQISELARLINAGDNEKAISVVENAIYKKIETQQGDKYVSEADVQYVSSKVDEITQLLGEGWADDVGAFTGTFSSWLSKKFGWTDAAKIKAKVTNIAAELVSGRAGSALTEEEWKRLVEPNIPAMSDSGKTFRMKLTELVDDPLTRLNSERTQFELPRINKNELVNRSARVPAYSSSSFGDTTQYKKVVDSYIDSNPGQASFVAELYDRLNATDQEIFDYLKQNGLIPN